MSNNEGFLFHATLRIGGVGDPEPNKFAATDSSTAFTLSDT